MVGFGVGVGVSVLAGATFLTAWTPSPELTLRIAEFHRFWKALAGYGIAFSDSLVPEASRLATVRRPVEKTALLLKEFDNRVTRFNRMNDRSTRIAASVLADLALDYRERKENDLYSNEETYILKLMARYRSLHSAMIPRCHTGHALDRATLCAGALSIFPGDVSSILDLFDETRRRIAGLNLPSAREDARFALLAMDSFCNEEWGVNHSRFIWELHFA
jgi:hypothetical protein